MALLLLCLRLDTDLIGVLPGTLSNPVKAFSEEDFESQGRPPSWATDLPGAVGRNVKALCLTRAYPSHVQPLRMQR